MRAERTVIGSRVSFSSCITALKGSCYSNVVEHEVVVRTRIIITRARADRLSAGSSAPVPPSTTGRYINWHARPHGLPYTKLPLNVGALELLCVSCARRPTTGMGQFRVSCHTETVASIVQEVLCGVRK